MHQKFSAEALPVVLVLWRQLNVHRILVLGVRVEVCPGDVDERDLESVLALWVCPPPYQKCLRPAPGPPSGFVLSSGDGPDAFFSFNVLIVIESRRVLMMALFRHLSCLPGQISITFK